MVEIQVPEDVLKDIKEKLTAINSRSEPLVKEAVNNTAKITKEKLNEQVKKGYKVKSSSFKKSSQKIKRATNKNLIAQIQADNSTLGLKKGFETKKNTVRKSRGGGMAARAAVFSDSSLKELIEKSYGHKAFFATVGNGHIGIFQRGTKGKYIKGQEPHISRRGGMTKGRPQIRELFGPRPSQMVKKSAEKMADEIGSTLQDELNKLMQQALGGKG